MDTFATSKNRSDMGLLAGKTALITGATRGIGRAIALRFAAEGADVAFTYRSQHEAAQSLVSELEAMGVRAKAYTSDAASFEDAHKVVEDVKETFGRIDVLVNNAGITKDGLMMRMDEAQWDAVIDTNLKSAFNFIHACTPVMARQRSGSIISMSSVVGVSGNAGQCNYSASKAGLIGLTKSMAKEMGPRGIRANCIAPGFIATDMTGALPENVRQEWEKQIPLRRGGTPEDVAGVAVFLASDLAGYVTGQVVNCCGGMNC
jgi:3-oxoacyl-[acyl-carrier protein] reductase